MNLLAKLDRWTDRHPWRAFFLATILLATAFWMTHRFDTGLSEAQLFVVRAILVSLFSLSAADTLFRRIL